MTDVKTNKDCVMEIKICDTCGLCAGCSYAINTALKTAKQTKNVVLFKEIVHNKNVNKMLNAQKRAPFEPVEKKRKNLCSVHSEKEKAKTEGEDGKAKISP